LPKQDGAQLAAVLLGTLSYLYFEASRQELDEFIGYWVRKEQERDHLVPGSDENMWLVQDMGAIRASIQDCRDR
jgi:hypothetical protein